MTVILGLYMQHKLKSTATLLLKLIFMLGALYLVFRKIDLSSTLQIIGHINPWFFGLALLSSVLSLAISGLRSQYYFEAFGLPLAKRYVMRLYFIGTFFNLALPGGIGGDGYKIYHIHKHFKFSKLKAFRVVLYERVNGFYVLCLLGFIIFYFSSFYHLPYAGLANTSLLILITPCYMLGIKYILKDNLRTACKATLYSLWVQLLQISLAISLLYGLAPDASIAVYIDFTLLFVVASILAIIPISIGGVGIRELTFLCGLELLGDTPGLITLGVAFALASFITYAVTALIGLPLYARRHS